MNVELGFIASDVAAGEFNRPAQCVLNRIAEFHDSLLDGYSEQFGNRVNAMKRMKELWTYMIHIFFDSERLGKKLFKIRTKVLYNSFYWLIQIILISCVIMKFTELYL